MKLIFLNIRNFAKKQPMFFIMVLASVLISSLLMVFSFGVYQNYKQEKVEYDYNQTTFDINFYYDKVHVDNENWGDWQYTYSGITKAEVEQFFTQIRPETYDNMWVCTTLLAEKFPLALMQGDKPTGQFFFESVSTRFKKYQDGIYYPYMGGFEFAINEGENFVGNMFTTEQYNSGENIVETTKEQLSDDGRWHYAGEVYEPVLIYEDGGRGSELPFPSIKDDALIEYVDIVFYDAITVAQYNELSKLATICFGDRCEIVSPEPAYQEDYWLYNTMIAIGVCIAIAAAINILILYSYILMKRRKTMAVFMLCGCTSGKAIRMYLGESLLLTVPLYAVSALLYHYLLLPVLERWLPYITTAYSMKLYLLVFGMYITACTIAMLILSIVMVRTQSIAERRNG